MPTIIIKWRKAAHPTVMDSPLAEYATSFAATWAPQLIEIEQAARSLKQIAAIYQN